MKILLITWYFAPSSTMGSVRLSKMVKNFLSEGHEVKIVTPRNVPHPQLLPLEIGLDNIQYTRWLDVNGITDTITKQFGFVRTARLGLVAGIRSLTPHPVETSSRGTEPGNKSSEHRHERLSTTADIGRSAGRLGRVYRNIFNCPDSRIGWLPYAVRSARRLARTWRPDIIFASGPPFTTLLAGHLTSKSSGVPWVAEFRDRWVDDSYYPPTGRRLRFETRLERMVATSAAGLVTVSEPWERAYREKYQKPTIAIYNGYDPSDYEDEVPINRSDSDLLRIVYTGGIYPGRRDPSPLFEALQLLGSERDQIRIEFFGTKKSRVIPIAEKYGVEHLVVVHDRVSNRESIRAQQNADVLLLMQWNNPLEQGNVPGKLFEYLAARRPILGLGLENGVPAGIIKERSAGYYINIPQMIADQLRAWILVKRREGQIPLLADTVRAGFSRSEQNKKLAEFLQQIVEVRPELAR